MISEKVGLRMKERRLSLGLTQLDLSTKCNISVKYYSSIENGRNSPSLEKLELIAKALQVSVPLLLNVRIEDMEKRVDLEKERLQNLFSKIPEDKLNLVEGLITQAARLRVLLDDNWNDILENGEYEKFRQSENQIAYDRKRPIVENYDNRDRTYQNIIKQLTDLLPESKQVDKKNRLLGKK